MTPIEWIAAGQLAVGAGQLAVGAVGVILVWQGLQQMRRAGDQREKREDARHHEAIQTLDSNHREAIQTLDSNHREAMQALANQAEAMRVLIERTGGSRGQEGTRA